MCLIWKTVNTVNAVCDYSCPSRSRRSRHSITKSIKGGLYTTACQMYYRIFLCVSTALLVYATVYRQHGTFVYFSQVSHFRTYYIVKNSTNDPEDKLLRNDRELIMDYDHPGAFWLPSQEVYFTSAFLDTRYNHSTVRVIGLQHRNHKVTPLCKFSIGNKTTLASAKVELIFPYWPGRSLYLAAIYNCDTPVVGFDKKSVEICSLKNLPCVRIPLTNPKEKETPERPKGELAICGKAYTGELNPSRFIEWVEINRLAGVSAVIVYDNGIRGWANQVIDHYKSVKFVKTVSFPLLEILHNHAAKHFHLSKEEHFSISQQAYLASVNDCIYRFMYRYDFFLIIDYDELLLPYREESLYFMALRLINQHPRRTGLTFYTSWHFSDFATTSPKPESQESAKSPKKQQNDMMYLLEHNRRTSITNNQPKSIVLSHSVVCVNWHGVVSSHPFSNFEQNALILPSTDTAYVHHYRGRCIDKFVKSDCNAMLRQAYVDDVVPRYAERLRSRVTEVYDVLGMRKP